MGSTVDRSLSQRNTDRYLKKKGKNYFLYKKKNLRMRSQKILEENISE